MPFGINVVDMYLPYHATDMHLLQKYYVMSLDNVSGRLKNMFVIIILSGGINTFESAKQVFFVPSL